MRKVVKSKSRQAPSQPGVYLFKASRGRVIYIGKAKNLRARLRSYGQESGPFDTKRDQLLDAARDLEWILVDNEKEALALENNLIKKIQPRYNVLLRDDKTYPYIKLTVKEKFPRVYVTRRLRKDGALYFGPYFPARLAHRIVDLIHRRFLVPSCKVDLTRIHPRPCLEYYIKRCQGPCAAGLTSDEKYGEAVRDVRLLLEARPGDLIHSLKERMREASRGQRFEEAARYRDLVSTIDQLKERQKLAASSGYDIDIFGIHREGSLAAVNLFHMRGGRVVDRREFFWEDLQDIEPGEFFDSLIKQCYLDQQYIPQGIHVPLDFEDRGVLEEILSERRGGKVEILTPQRGQKRALLDLVGRNARHSFERRFRVLKPTPREVAAALAEALDLQKAPHRIECFDISHLQGTDTVASMVVWEKGRMRKSDYRKFIVKTVDKNDDFASIREVVGRRYRRLQREKKAMPDLVLIDGGLGQLHAAASGLEEMEIINQPLASIAKKEEIIYVQGREAEPIRLEPHSPLLHLVQQIRDETHRFAVSFHRLRRSKSRFSTELLGIRGVGEKTGQLLMRRFGSVKALRTLNVEELARAVPLNRARQIHAYLQAGNT